MECTSCGVANDASAKFCKSCGAVLVQVAEVEVKESTVSKPASEPQKPSASATAGNASPHMSVSYKKGSGLKAGNLNIHGKVVNYGGTLLAINNIEKVSTHIPQPSFPTSSLVLIVLGIIALFLLPPAGILLLLLGVGLIAWWFYKCSKAPKGVTMALVSGRSMVIHFSDHDLANKVVDALEAAISDEDVEVSFEMPAGSSMEEVSASGGLLGGLSVGK